MKVFCFVVNNNFMKTQKKFNEKKAFYILKEIFKDKKGKVSTVNLQDISLKISKKYLLTALEIQQLLSLLSELDYIDMLAKNTQKGYTYTVKLKIKGEDFLKRKSSKFADFFLGIFVYIAFVFVLVLLIFILRKIFTIGYV